MAVAVIDGKDKGEAENEAAYRRQEPVTVSERAMEFALYLFVAWIAILATLRAITIPIRYTRVVF